MLSFCARRRRPVLVFGLLSVFFIWMNVHWMMSNWGNGNHGEVRSEIMDYPRIGNAVKVPNQHGISIVNKLRLEQHINLTFRDISTSSTWISQSWSDNASVDTNDLTQLKSFTLDNNVKQRIYNGDKFKTDLMDRNGIVLIIQVHDRAQYLKLLIDSLRTARDISQVLVIFSHDFISNEINALIRDIDFCAVMQIFYPYSMQMYPKEFPGEDPNDCPRDLQKEEARKRQCNNADHPDMFGHYREAKFAQTKHHWFWKIHRVFDELQVTKTFNGPVVLLEEDHYVVPDFVHVVRQMYLNKNSLCPSCTVLTLGTYDKNPSFQTSDKVQTYNWLSSKHNMAMTIDRDTWNDIKHCTNTFCDYDDYNWDWSLQHISAICLQKPLVAMVVASPRVFHMGECGIHHKGKKCDPRGRLDAVNNLISSNKHQLFPQSLSSQGISASNKKFRSKPNGGWGDVRDRELCKSFINDSKQKR